jgi:eukaryotic-like serine/threonine-protein kinase
LEQYGSDIGHTDVRSDIYSFGRNPVPVYSPTMPRRRRVNAFYTQTAWLPLRQLNPEYQLYEPNEPFMWAMNLHPDERPQNIEAFRDALFGSRPLIINVSRKTQPTRPLNLREILRSPIEQILIWVLAGLAVISLVITLWR